MIGSADELSLSWTMAVCTWGMVSAAMLDVRLWITIKSLSSYLLSYDDEF